MLPAVAIALLDSSSLQLALDDSGLFQLPLVAFGCLYLGGFWGDLLTPVDQASSGWPQLAPARGVCANIPDFSAVSTTWHSNDDDVYRAPPIDRSILPTAPRAAREPNVDRSRLPKSPPYTAFLGNLPYDVTEESIKDFFRGLNVSDIPEGRNAMGTQDAARSLCWAPISIAMGCFPGMRVSVG